MRPDGPRGITEEDLQAYLDETLERDRRLDVALYLAMRPSEAARIEAFRAQKEGLHLLFDEVIAQKPPRKLRRVVRRNLARKAMGRLALVVAAMGMGAILVLGGGALGGHFALTRGVDRSSAVSGGEASTVTRYPIIPPPLRPLRRRGAEL